MIDTSAHRLGRYGRAAAGVCLVGLLAACAADRVHENTAAASAEAALDPAVLAVKSRAEARWQALIQHDFARAYTFLSPGRRSAQTVEQYINTPHDSRLTWTGADWLGAVCEAERCVAKLRISTEYLHPNPGAGRVPVSAPVEEIWLKIGGEWYFAGE